MYYGLARNFLWTNHNRALVWHQLCVIKASCLLHLFEKSTEDGSLVKFASVVFNIELDRLYLQRTISHQRPWLILQGNTSTREKVKNLFAAGRTTPVKIFFYCAFAYFRCLRKHNRVRGNEIKHLASELTIRTTVPKHFNTKYPRGIFLIV